MLIQYVSCNVINSGVCVSVCLLLCACMCLPVCLSIF